MPKTIHSYQDIEEGGEWVWEAPRKEERRAALNAHEDEACLI